MSVENLEIGDTILIVYKSLHEKRMVVTGLTSVHWRYVNDRGNEINMTLEFLERMLSGFYSNTIIHTEIIKNEI